MTSWGSNLTSGYQGNQVCSCHTYTNPARLKKEDGFQNTSSVRAECPAEGATHSCYIYSGVVVFISLTVTAQW